MEIRAYYAPVLVAHSLVVDSLVAGDNLLHMPRDIQSVAATSLSVSKSDLRWLLRIVALRWIAALLVLTLRRSASVVALIRHDEQEIYVKFTVSCCVMYCAKLL